MAGSCIRTSARARIAAAASVALALAASSVAAADPGTHAADAADDAAHGTAPPDDRGHRAIATDAAVRLDPRRDPHGGAVPEHFVGLSIEWSLIERYMNPNARPAFTRLLANLGTGMLRIGGSSQDTLPFSAEGPDTNARITPQDLRAIRETLDAVNAGAGGRPRWGAILGTAMAPPADTRPWRSPAHARAFTQAGVAPAFGGDGAGLVAGIELGNEPDLTYRGDLGDYLDDFATYVDEDVTAPFAVIAPNTSEPIATWEEIASRTGDTRFFWDWPAILDATGPAMAARPGPFGAFATDHFYPASRCVSTLPYRCATIPRVLSDDRMARLAYQVHEHAGEAARRGLGYRLEELNTASGRGDDGVSDVAASALWGLEAMLTAACPQPPDAPGANAGCELGAVGVNFHNAERLAFSRPDQGNAYYNAIAFDPSPAMGPVAARPLYYAMLLFAHHLQGARGLRPADVTTAPASSPGLKAWTVDGDAATRRLVLVNKSAEPVTVTISAPGSGYAMSRMTPHDPAGSGRVLDAPEMRIDGRAVGADGTWPGFAPEAGAIRGGRFAATLAGGEAAVVTVHD
jgi:hypothetical protein